ncbi:MAG: MBL fold metallo-hydrolase [Candidatus Thermoplasmatota archaeon]
MVVYAISGKGYDSNVYIIPGTKTTVIDTGTGMNKTYVLDQIQRYIDIQDIDQIVLTHEHFDHVGGVSNILQALPKKVTIFAHAHAIESLKSGVSEFADILGIEMPKILVDHPLYGEEQIVLGDEQYLVLSTPGHSLGGLCLYGKTSKTLFSGDIVFAYGGFGRYDFIGGNKQALFGSIRKLAALEISDLYPGHGEYILRYGYKHVQQALEMLSKIQ